MLNFIYNIRSNVRALLAISVISILMIIACSADNIVDYSTFSNVPSANNQLADPGNQFPITPPAQKQPRYIMWSKTSTALLPKLENSIGDCIKADNPDSALIRDCHGISYNGGPVMSDPINIYLIWYGQWKDTEAKRIVEEFVSNVGGSDYWHINEMYCDISSKCVSGVIKLAGTINKSDYLKKAFISEDDIGTIAIDTMRNKEFPIDASGMYIVLTSNELNVTDSCSSYCGWHSSADIDGTSVKYAFIQDVSKCPESCSAFSDSFVNLIPPNNNVSGDGMVNTVAHEMDEMATDPMPSLNGIGSAWADGYFENGDHCGWMFPKTYHTLTNGDANIKLRSGDYLVQGNWVLKEQGYCSVDIGPNPVQPQPQP